MRRSFLDGVLGALAFFALCSATARADVIASAPHGFSIKASVRVEAEPMHVYNTIAKEVGSWWDSGHTFFGNAKNLSIEAKPGGCFCETAGGSRGVRHMTVVFVDPGKTLRMQGGLGPFSSMGVQGALTFSITRVDPGSRVELVYNVGGFAPDGLDKIAPTVDGVLTGQLNRLKKYLDTGKPE